ncbi:MAG: SpoIVB peptidase [Lachnospiraceae bacterium]|nr:SpoIVB peptidase [Lachnospiraceae bacterium]
MQVKEKRLLCYRIFLYFVLAATAVTMMFVYKFGVVDTVPDTILLRKGQEEVIEFPVPVTARIQPAGAKAPYPVSQNQIAETMSQSAAGIETPVTTSVSIVSGDAVSYTMDLKYMGIFPMKSVKLSTVSDRQVLIGGQPIAIYVKSEGVLVIDTGSYVNQEGEEVSPSEDVLQPGDYIMQVDGETVPGKRQFIEMIENSDEQEMILTIRRGGQVSQVVARPQRSEDGVCKLGIWVRDSAQGIGTLSYITQDGKFAALGHGVNDTDVGCLMELGRGSIYETSILAIRKAEDERPGELTGVLTFEETDFIGSIEENTDKGIYGNVSAEFVLGESGEEFLGDCAVYPVALKQEVQAGPAQIYFELEEAPAFYDVYIDEVHHNSGVLNRGIMLTITDEKLLERTGGIVQGMSGSPIVQNGKVVGAVTHVLVNDPTKGYGIFLESMLNNGN